MGAPLNSFCHANCIPLLISYLTGPFLRTALDENGISHLLYSKTTMFCPDSDLEVDCRQSLLFLCPNRADHSPTAACSKVTKFRPCLLTEKSLALDGKHHMLVMTHEDVLVVATE